jgi:hypothetical protein
LLPPGHKHVAIVGKNNRYDRMPTETTADIL